MKMFADVSEVITGHALHAPTVGHKLQGVLVDAAKVAQGKDVLGLVGGASTGRTEQQIAGIDNAHSHAAIVRCLTALLQGGAHVCHQGIDKAVFHFFHVGFLLYYICRGEVTQKAAKADAERAKSYTPCPHFAKCILSAEYAFLQQLRQPRRICKSILSKPASPSNLVMSVEIRILKCQERNACGVSLFLCRKAFCKHCGEVFAEALQNLLQCLQKNPQALPIFLPAFRHFAEATARRADGSRRVLRKIKKVTKCQPALPQTVSIIRKSHTEKQKSHHKPKKSSKMFVNTSKDITFAAETNSKPCLTTLHASAITLAFTLRKT